MSTTPDRPDPHSLPEDIKSFLDTSPDCLSILDPEGMLCYCNPVHEKVFGYPFQEIKDLWINELAFIPADDRKRLMETLSTTRKTGRPVKFIMHSVTKEGAMMDLDSRLTPMIHDGSVYAFQLTNNDITGQEERGGNPDSSVLKFENILDGIADPILLHRMDPSSGPAEIVYCNREAESLTGYTRKELLGMRVSDIGHTESGLEDHSFYQDIGKGRSLLFERIIVRKDKSIFPVEIHARMIEYEGEKMVLSLMRDVTRRKKSEEETSLHLMFEKIVSKISSRFINMPDGRIENDITRTLKEVSEFIGANRGGIFLFDEKGEYLYPAYEWCQDPDQCRHPFNMILHLDGSGLITRRLDNLRDVVLDKIDELPKDADEERKWYNKHGFVPAFIVPIVSDNKLAGALGLAAEDNRRYKWPRQYSHLLRYIASVLYSAIMRKEMSLKLRRSQFTLDHYSDGVFWISTPDFRVVDINPAACENLGYSREELLGKTVSDFDPGFSNMDPEILWKEIRKGGRNALESVHRRKDGSEYPVEVLAILMEFEGEEFIVSFSRDITGRKEAELQLKRSEQEYRNIFENVTHVFYEASLDGILLNVTPSVQRLTKYTQEEILGKSMEVFYYDPSVREPLLKELYKKGEVLDFEMDVRDKDGSPVPTNLNVRVLYDEENRPERIVGSLADLRIRRKAERQVRQLSTALQQSPVSVIIADTDTSILYINDSFVEFSGMQPEEIIGKTPYEITREQIPVREYNDFWTVVKSGDVWKRELEYVKNDGQNVWLSITVSPVMDEKDQPINFVGILEVISERKKAEHDLRKAKEEAEKSDHLKSAFLANMSHEIRTPMNAILGFSNLLKEGGLEDEQSRYYIDIINSKGRDLLRIISDIIDISRIEAGDLFIRMEPVELHPFMHELYNEFKEDTQVRSRTNLQFRLNIPESEEMILIRTDPARLKQVMVNLVQNALKFTPGGFVEMGFKLIKNQIQFFVKDSGIGIPEDKRRIIFQRFRQIDESQTREYGGTGLGLAICKNLLELMDSDLRLQSSSGQGSEFWFKLDYTKTSSKVEKPGREETEIGDMDLNLKGKKILIAEDDGSSYLYLESLLNRYQPEIIWAKSGRQVLDILSSQEDIDLILMDIRMPEMDGLTATMRIREMDLKIPVIAQTAYAQVNDRKLAIESGCNEYLSKPVSPVELIGILGRYLNQDG